MLLFLYSPLHEHDYDSEREFEMPQGYGSFEEPHYPPVHPLFVVGVL